MIMMIDLRVEIIKNSKIYYFITKTNGKFISSFRFYQQHFKFYV